MQRPRKIFTRTANRSSYKDTLDYLYSLQGLGIRPGLKRIKGLLKVLGNPQKSYPSVIVAGTNGKGSTSAMLTSILAEGGYGTGLYTSPHLTRFNERIRVNLKPVSDKEIVEATAIVRKAAGESAPAYGEPTFFELTTAIAFEIFRRRRVDIAVLEVGMGGRFDATNVVSPLVAAITNIGLDHTGYFGTDLTRIAYEKAGIIKKGATVVTSETRQAPVRVISRIAGQKGSDILKLGKDFNVTPSVDKAGRFEYLSAGLKVKGLSIPLSGPHQIRNAACALAAAEALSEKGFPLTPVAVKRGLARAAWPGRFEVVKKKPTVILDCAHNPEGAKTLVDTLTGLKPKSLILVIGVMKDKDIGGILKSLSALAPVTTRVIAASPAMERSAPPELLARMLKKYFKEVGTEKTVKKAVMSALVDPKAFDTVVVTGSIFTVGEARSLFIGRSG